MGFGPMTPERWQRLKALFADALGEPAGDEPRSQVPEGLDDDLASELRVLLDEHARADGFLESPADTVLWSELDRVRPYAVVREIGRGGMVTVYLASRDDCTCRRNAALKGVRR